MSHLEVQVRETPPAGVGAEGFPWRAAGTFPADTAQLVVEDLVMAATVDYRVRHVDDHGTPSDWVTRFARLLERPPEEEPPDPPHRVRISKRDCLIWESVRHTRDIRGFLVRHCPWPFRDWERAEPAHEGLVKGPPFVLCRVPRGRRVFLVKTVDVVWRESAEPTVVEIDRGSMDDHDERIIRQVDLAALNWPGDLQGGLRMGTIQGTQHPGVGDDTPCWLPELEPAYSVDTDFPGWDHGDGPAWSPLLGESARAWPRNPAADPWAAAWHWIEYAFSVVVGACEGGPETVLTLDVVVSSDAPWRVEYRRPESDPAWSENPFDPAWGADIDPAWVTTPVAWGPWPGRLDHVEPGVHRFRVLVPAAFEQTEISEVTYTLSRVTRTERQLGLAVPATGARVPLSEAFAKLEEVEPRLVGGAPGAKVEILDKHRTDGPELRVLDAAGNAIAGVVDVAMHGR